MIKKFVLIALCALPLGLIAQEAKFGHINTQDVISLMPEVANIQKTVDEVGKQYEGEIMKMQEEYNAKVKEFQEKQDSMPEGIKKVRITEIQEIETRVNTFRQTAYQEIQKKQQDLFIPIRDKVTKAINDVAVEGKYTYILDLGSQAVIYKSPTSNDITAAVKKKLALK
jgi:outer membrane protein